MIIAKSSPRHESTPETDGAETPSDPARIEALFDEALTRLEEKGKADALKDWRQQGRAADDFNALWSDTAKQNGAPQPFRVRVLNYQVPLPDLMAAAHPREGVPPVTNNMLRNSVAVAVSQHAATLRAQQANGHWFLWNVVKHPNAYREQLNQIAGGKTTQQEGFDAQTVYVSQPSLEEAPTQDTIGVRRDRMFSYELHFLDVTGNPNVGFDNKPISTETPRAQTESATMERLTSMLADKLAPKAPEPAGKRT